MESKTLLNGFEFAIKYSLTKREVEILILFIGKNLKLSEVAEILESNANTLHHTMQKLKLKGVLILESKDTTGHHIYKFNEDI